MMPDMPAEATEALEVTVMAPVVSFRNPLYAGVQVGLPCPPPATVAGMLAAATGGWAAVDPELRFAMAFHAAGSGVDLETYHPLEATGRKADPTPREREFLANVTLTVWLVDDVAVWERRLRRPVWPLRLGRSQDLVAVRTRRLALRSGPGRQHTAIVPDRGGAAGMLLRLPTAVARDRSRTRWDPYRYDAAGRTDALIAGAGATPTGQAIVLLHSTHPSHAERETRS